jgi:hypothetical protein
MRISTNQFERVGEMTASNRRYTNAEDLDMLMENSDNEDILGSRLIVHCVVVRRCVLAKY